VADDDAEQATLWMGRELRYSCGIWAYPIKGRVRRSRLAEEFVGKVADRARSLKGRYLPYGDGITFWPIADVVHEAADIVDGDHADKVRSRIEALLPRGGSELEAVPDQVVAATGVRSSSMPLLPQDTGTGSGSMPRPD
jgi:hypothetical protein